MFEHLSNLLENLDLGNLLLAALQSVLITWGGWRALVRLLWPAAKGIGRGLRSLCGGLSGLLAHGEVTVSALCGHVLDLIGEPEAWAASAFGEGLTLVRGETGHRLNFREGRLAECWAGVCPVLPQLAPRERAEVEAAARALLGLVTLRPVPEGRPTPAYGDCWPTTDKGT